MTQFGTRLPANVLAVLKEFRVCEFTTRARDGTPITTPLPALFEPEVPRFIMTTSIGLPLKALRIRRDPRVALLFSDPTGSGLGNPSAVLVQGNATAPDKVVTSMRGLEPYWRDVIFARQPRGEDNHRTALARWMLDWYYMRIIIDVRPIRFMWWDEGEFNLEPHILEVRDVD